MFSAPTSGFSSRMCAMRSSTGIPTDPVEKLMIISGTSDRIASRMSLYAPTRCVGVPSGSRAWMCTIVQPFSNDFFDSDAYSSGVYGMYGHCVRFAATPDSATVITDLSSSPISLPPSPFDQGAAILILNRRRKPNHHRFDQRPLQRTQVHVQVVLGRPWRVGWQWTV